MLKIVQLDSNEKIPKLRVVKIRKELDDFFLDESFELSRDVWKFIEDSNPYKNSGSFLKYDNDKSVFSVLLQDLSFFDSSMNGRLKEWNKRIKDYFSYETSDSSDDNSYGHKSDPSSEYERVEDNESVKSLKKKPKFSLRRRSVTPNSDDSDEKHDRFPKPRSMMKSPNFSPADYRNITIFKDTYLVHKMVFEEIFGVSPYTIYCHFHRTGNCKYGTKCQKLHENVVFLMVKENPQEDFKSRIIPANHLYPSDVRGRFEFEAVTVNNWSPTLCSHGYSCTNDPCQNKIHQSRIHKNNIDNLDDDKYIVYKS